MYPINTILLIFMSKQKNKMKEIKFLKIDS